MLRRILDVASTMNLPSPYPTQPLHCAFTPAGGRIVSISHLKIIPENVCRRSASIDASVPTRPFASSFVHKRLRARHRSTPSPSVVASLDASSLPPSVGVTKDPGTGATILVVGCVHGSRQSARDVETVMQAAGRQMQAVVLELCPQRLRGLMKSLHDENSSLQQTDDRAPHRPAAEQERSSFPRFPFLSPKLPSPQTIREFIARFGGVAPAALAFALGSVYNVQRLSGSDPGTEFKAALRMVLSRPRSESPPCLIVCGDAPATDTIRGLVAVVHPLRALQSARRGLLNGFQALVRRTRGGIQVPLVLLDSFGARLREFMVAFIPLLIGLYVIGFTAAAAATKFRADLFELDQAAAAAASVGEIWHVIGPFSAAVSTFLQGYVVIASLALVQVLISERDVTIAKSIQATALDIQSRPNSAGDSEVVIVAVVGMLHVNGILRYISRRTPVS